MAIRHFFHRAIQSMLKAFGFVMIRINSSHLTMEAAVKFLLKQQIQIKTVVDIGASNGSWSQIMMSEYPFCDYLLIEAQRVHEKSLQEFCLHHENARYSLVAAGDSDGEIYFDATDPFTGQASVKAFEKNNVVVPMARVDSLVKRERLEGPFLLKLDTHGFEIPILEGSRKTLEETIVIVMECYNFRIAPECLLFYEMCNYLAKRGFRCIDLVSPLHRPLDNSFWQMDLVFVRNDRPEFSDLRYSADSLS